MFAAIPAVAEDNNAETVETVLTADNASITTAGAYILKGNLTADVTVDVDGEVSIDLAGHKITNSKSHTIEVKQGTLIITDSSKGMTGTVDNIIHARGALFVNEGATAVLNGGNFDRSHEEGTNPKDSGGNSWYTICNKGTLEINPGVTVKNGDGTTTGKFSSLICNETGSENKAILTINGGTFTGGLYIKNGIGDEITIKGGTFDSYTASVFSYGKLTITDGTFNEGTWAAVVSYAYGAYTPELTISGGNYKAGTSTDGSISIDKDANATATSTVSISGMTEYNAKKVVSVYTTITGTIGIGNNSITCNELAPATGESIVFSEGSIVIGGTVDESTPGNIVITGGNAQINVSEIPAGMTITVNANATLLIPADVALNGAIINNGSVKNDGAITGSGSITGTGKVTIGVNGSIEASVNTSSVEVVVDESGMETQYVGGTASTGETNYSANQIVQVIDGQDWKLVSGAVVTIKGQLVVPEGSKVIIEDGAQLIINGKIASEIDGVVSLAVDMDETATSIGEVDYYGGILKIDNSTVNFNADVEISGSLVVVNKGIANFNANITVSEYGVIASGATETVKVSEVSVMTVNGSMNVAKISNYGAVVIDSAVASASSEISLLASGAYVDVVRYTVAKDTTLASLTITDMGIKIGKLESVARTNTITIVPATTSDDSAALFTVYGIKVTESAVVATEASPSTNKYINNVMDISGDVKTSASTETESPYPVTTVIVTINSGAATSGITPVTSKGFTVSDALTVGQNVTVIVDGEIVVTGTVTAVAKAVAASGSTPASAAAEFTVRTGKLVMKDTGLVQVPNTNVLAKDKVEAAVYETTVDTTTKYNNYVTVDSALDKVNADSTVTKVEVLNNQTVTKNNTVPTGVTLTVTYDMKVGSSTNRDVTLTTAADAGKITIADGKKIIVYGTLYAENKSKLNTEAQVQSDVKSVQLNEKGVAVKNGWAKFTNLYTAMEEANAGETITVSTYNLIIDRNLTIKDQVTLAIPETVDANNVAVTVKDGVTITVNGYIVTQAQLTADSKYATSASTVDGQKSSAFVLGPNGYIAYTGTVDYMNSNAVKTLANTNIAGAYYSVEINFQPYNVVSSLETAIADIENITSANIILNGKITAGDVTFTAADVCKNIVVNNGNDTAVEFQSLVLDGSTLTAEGGFTGAVTVADVTVSFIAVKTFNVSDVEDVMTFGEGTIFAASGASASDSLITLVAGTMKASVGSGVKFIVGTGATLEAIATNYTFDELVIDGTVSVPAGKQLTGNTTTINDNGTLDVAALTATTDKGTFTVTTFNVGIVGKDYLGAAASVTGPVTLGTNGVAYVAAGVDITEDAFTNDDVKSTALYIGDELWMTIYTNRTILFSSLQNENDKIPVENAKFKYWADADGNDLGTMGKSVGDVPKAIAKVDYNVYTVVIMANAGVENVSIDGNLLPYYGGSIFGTDDISLGYQAPNLTAGKHTITYTLANGYSGTAKLEVNGSVPEGMECTLNGMEFNISGDFEELTLVLQLTGIEKSGYVPEFPDAPAESGMGITDYLLIILVVLIVVMAIIVAMRLMRS